jgi:NAD(P)-dependent dehydrogenase (short-subunit alcohol dehydrogenase family)
MKVGGKVVAVTGGAHGIGAALGRRSPNAPGARRRITIAGCAACAACSAMYAAEEADTSNAYAQFLCWMMTFGS